MADHDDEGESPEPTPEKRPLDKDPIVGEVDAYAVLSYLIGGVVLYGGIGWLLDYWLGTRAFVAVGIVAGAALGIVSVWLRYSKH